MSAAAVTQGRRQRTLSHPGDISSVPNYITHWYPNVGEMNPSKIAQMLYESVILQVAMTKCIMMKVCALLKIESVKTAYCP